MRPWPAGLLVLSLLAACGGAGGGPPGSEPDGRQATPPPVNAGPGGGATVPTSTPAAPTTTLPPSGPPPAITDPAWSTSAGDGRWQGAGRRVLGAPAVFTTTLHRGGSTYGVAWMDQRRLRLVLYAGTSQPAGVWAHDGAVAGADTSSLVAAFNSGFKLAESQGGWYADGRAAVALAVGAASLVIRSDGTATIGSWGLDVGMTADVAAVRQNLQLLVDGGAPTAAVGFPDQIHTWGDPLHENVVTWRSAIALDRAGQLLYVAASAATPADLAAAVIAAGGQRAMELDINPQWVSFDTFTGSGPSLSAAKLLPTMAFPATHFLQPYFRDFFAAMAR